MGAFSRTFGNSLGSSGAGIDPKYTIIGTQKWDRLNFDETQTVLGNAIPEASSNGTWISSDTLYANAISGGGTEHEALMAAAMWCYYNNSSANNATYGKLYNWYAVKLFQVDIDTYNAGGGEYGRHIPSLTEYQTMISYVGGVSAYAKIKSEDGWVTPGTNTSRLTVLPASNRVITGGFEPNNNSFLWTYDFQMVIVLNGSNISYFNGNSQRERGLSLRFVSDSTFPITLS